MIACRILAAVVLTLLAACPGRADDYPAGAIKLVVPYAAGGPVDVVGRIIGQHLAELELDARAATRDGHRTDATARVGCRRADEVERGERTTRDRRARVRQVHARATAAAADRVGRADVDDRRPGLLARLARDRPVAEIAPILAQW